MLFEASANERQAWLNLLTAHQEQLRDWAENYPPTFADKHALVSAEIARLQGRDADATRLMSGPFNRHATTILSRTRRWPTSWPHDSMRREASRGSRTSVYGTPGAAISSGARTARSRASTNVTRTWRKKDPRPLAPQQLARASHSWTSRRWSRPHRRCRARLFSRT